MIIPTRLILIGHMMLYLLARSSGLNLPVRTRIRFLSTTATTAADGNQKRKQRCNESLLNPSKYQPRKSQSVFYATASATPVDNAESDNLSNEERKVRISALHEQLSNLGVDAEHLSDAVQKSMTTMTGNDPYYGKSAIKAYRTFVYPRPSKIKAARDEDVRVTASRCARQIDFLAKRNRSHEAEWVRHTDVEDEVGDSTRKLFPLVILLDNVRSAFNVGSIFRTADACGCSMVITTGITPSPHGSGREKLQKSALNADKIVPSKHFTTTKEAVEYLRENHPGFELIGMETTELSKPYTSESYPGEGQYTKNGILPESGSVLVLGNEVSGVDTEIMPLLDKIVEIPMFGTKNSLNIAACAPVVVYEILRQWGAMSQ